VKAAALVVVFWLAAAAAAADERGWQPDAVFSQVGAGSATNAWSVGGQWHWKRAWALRDSLVLRGRWEFAVGRWRTQLDDGERDQSWITQVSLVPTLRLTRPSGRGWYGEIGSGPAMLMPVFHSRGREFSTEFNFQSHLAVGYVLGDRGEHDLGLRIEHFSNAGIHEPNPGMNFASLRYTYRFGGGSERLRFAGAKEQRQQVLRGPPQAVSTPSPM
jgi:lipid A 3-O-deacylase